MKKEIKFSNIDDLGIGIHTYWKRLAAIMIAGALTISVSGCGTQELKESDIAVNSKTEITEDVETDLAKAPEAEPESQEIEPTETRETEAESQDAKKEAEAEQMSESESGTEVSFADLVNLQFCFSSGAGAWATMLNIHADGSFSGEYYDSDMGDTGDGYPNGSMYYCDFSGKFTKLVKVNDFTYSMEISEIKYADEVGKEEIQDGVLYRYTDAYGLNDAKTILLYLPGTPLAELSEDFRIWVGYYDLVNAADTELPFYALNNETYQYGFTSYDRVEQIKEVVSNTESGAAALEHSINNDPLTQSEYNEKTQELYELWDSALNMVWDVLKSTKDSAAMEEITVEEREWIASKEQAVAEAGVPYEGGSMQAMAMNQKAAELTRERVYVLLDLLDVKY